MLGAVHELLRRVGDRGLSRTRRLAGPSLVGSSPRRTPGRGTLAGPSEVGAGSGFGLCFRSDFAALGRLPLPALFPSFTPFHCLAPSEKSPFELETSHTSSTTRPAWPTSRSKLTNAFPDSDGEGRARRLQQARGGRRPTGPGPMARPADDTPGTDRSGLAQTRPDHRRPRSVTERSWRSWSSWRP
jgi:hypothetical protein